MCDIDFDPPSFYHSTTRRARKIHRCIECHGPIPPGTRYLHVFGVWDGDASGMHTHLECYELWEFVRDVVCGGEGAITHGGLYEECRHAADEYGLCGYDEERDEYAENPLLGVLKWIRDTYVAMEANRG